MKKKFIVYAVLMFVFAISVSGCDNSSQDNSLTTVFADEISKEGLHTYTSTELFESVEAIVLAEPYNNGLYVYASTAEDSNTASLYYCDIDDATISKVDYDTDETTLLIAMDVASNGDLWLVKYVQNESNGEIQDGYQIDIVSNDSNDVTIFEHEPIDSFPSKLIMSESTNKVYLYSTGDIGNESEYIYVYNMKGEQLAEVVLDTTLQSIAFSEKDNKLYILDSDNTIGVLNEDNYSVEELIQVESVTNSKIFENSQYSFCIEFNSILMGFDSDTNIFTPLIDWTANGISGTARYVMSYDEYYIVIHSDTVSNMDKIVKLSETSGLQSDKEELKLATMKSNELINYAVAYFNNQSNNYYITIVDYSIYGDDALQKLQIEIISGEIPDIFDMNDLPTDEYISKGILEDLDPYMRADLNLDDYWESALSTIYDGEKCYLVVPCFAITTIFENGDDATNLSYSEMLSYIRENADEQINAFGSEIEFMEYMVSCYFNQFIDWDNKACYFDSNEFIELLDAASSVESLDEDYDDYIMINKGQQSISFQWIYDIRDISFLAAVFNDNYSIINVSIDKDEAGAIMLPLYSFGMSSSSDYKDGAWEFLQYLYSDEAQEIIEFEGIPMKKSNLDTQLEELKEVINDEERYGTTGYTYITHGEEYFIPFVNNRLDAYQETLDLINSVDRLFQSDTSIMEIIEEEVSACLEGDKSAEEVAAIIQNRASIYINEQS